MFEINVNEQPFKEWESVKITRSIDNPSGAFQFTGTAVTSAEEYPVRVGDLVQVLVKKTPKVTGYVDRITDDFSLGKHLITVVGRDTTQDIIDSDIRNEAKSFNKPVNFKDICLKVISTLGANVSPVVDVSGVNINFTVDELFNAKSGRNAMEFLVSFARKKQVYLLADGRGGLLIFRPKKQESFSEINNTTSLRSNILEYTAIHSQEKRYHTYNTKSQDNFSFFDDASYTEGVDNSGTIIDSEIRKGRYVERQSEELMSNEEVIRRTKEQLNISRALSIVYKVKVQDALQSKDGDPWDVGLLVKINDAFAGLKGLFLIKAVDYTFNLGGGTVTELTCVPPEAYRGTSDITVRESRRNTLTGKYQRSTPTTARRFVR